MRKLFLIIKRFFMRRFCIECPAPLMDCDYTVNISLSDLPEKTLCEYYVNLSEIVFPVFNLMYNINGVNVVLGNFTDFESLNNAFRYKGFQVQGDGQYYIGDTFNYTTNTYDSGNYRDNLNIVRQFDMVAYCNIPISQTLIYPIVITLTKNGYPLISQVLADEAAVIAWFVSIGWTNTSDMIFTITNSLDTFAPEASILQARYCLDINDMPFPVDLSNVTICIDFDNGNDACSPLGGYNGGMFVGDIVDQINLSGIEDVFYQTETIGIICVNSPSHSYTAIKLDGRVPAPVGIYYTKAATQLTTTLPVTSACTPLAAIGGCTIVWATNYNADAEATFDDGSCVFESEGAVVFDTASKKAVQTKIGACIFQKYDLDKLPGFTAKSIELNFQTYYVTFDHINNANAGVFTKFLNDVNADAAVYLPIKPFPFPSFHDWMVNTFDPVFIQLDQESELQERALSNADYITNARLIMARYPLKKASWDTAPIYRIIHWATDRNKSLIPLTDTDWGRGYRQLAIDRIVFDPLDQNLNLALVNTYYSYIMPTDDDAYFNLLPNIHGKPEIQWHTTDTGRQRPSDIITNYSIGEMARATLATTERTPYIFWMRLAEIVGGVHVEFESMKIISPLFRFAFTFPVSFSLSGVKGQGVTDGVNRFGMIITNQTSNEYLLPANMFTIPGKTISGNFTVKSVFGDSLTAPYRTESVSSLVLKINKNSTTYVEFDTV